MVKERAFTYTLIESLSTTHGALGKPVYGVQGHYMIQGREKICTVADVSPDRVTVEKLVETLTRLQPSPEILSEIVEDYLVETYTL